MSRENKYLKEFLNLLDNDQVFHSYLSNRLMLNQVHSLLRELTEGKKSDEEVEMEVQNLIKSVEILVSNPAGMAQVNLTREEFCNLLRTVKQQTIQNLAERRMN